MPDTLAEPCGYGAGLPTRILLTSKRKSYNVVSPEFVDVSLHGLLKRDQITDKPRAFNFFIKINLSKVLKVKLVNHKLYYGWGEQNRYWELADHEQVDWLAIYIEFFIL